MTDSGQPASRPPKKRGWLVLKSLLIRLWALAILLMVLAVAYYSLDYMVGYVFYPEQVPPRILEWQSELDPELLRVEAAPGVTQEPPRAPMGHYHGVDKWYEPAGYVSCTISGCHSPLPHQERKEIRAFANLHATFMTCQMCHEKSTAPSEETVWLNHATGTILKGKPPLLELINLLETTESAPETEEFTEQVIELLDTSLVHMGSVPFLEHLRVQLNTTLPGSPVWTQTMRELRQEIPQHARGEYGARLAPAAGGRKYVAFHQDLAKLAGEYLSASDDAARERLNTKIHAQVNPEPSACLACHGGDPPRMNFVKAGYTEARAESLANEEIARLMDRIMKGQPFHLPRIMLPGASAGEGSQE